MTIAIALAVGMLAQVAARHLRIPGIVLLLAAGVLLGPDLAGVVQPQSLGPALQVLVGYAVAIVLFEGGMNLNLRRLQRSAQSIRQLVTTGAVVTAVGGALSARLLLGWDWPLSVLFGTLVIVTGPTVITPILKRLRLKKRVATVLEAEGVLIDAVGAIIAVVTLEVILHPASGAVAASAQALASRLILGTVLGFVSGFVMARLLRSERLVPEGLDNVLVLSAVLVLFQASNTLLSESGIVSVTIAGLVIGNSKTRLLGDLREFKEQLTVLMIGMLFVLLAADVRIAEIQALGIGGALTVAALIFIVRPLNVLVGTRGSSLAPKEKLFLAWMAPRGIVAAAVSSLFAQELTAAGIEGGNTLRALVFLVIATTVLVQGLTGSIVARALGLRRPTNAGYLILGANPLGLAVGEVLRSGGQEVVFIDTNPDASHAAEEAGFRVLFGSGLVESILVRAEVDSRAGCVAVTLNDEVNLLFARKAREEFRVPKVWVALRKGRQGVTRAMVDDIGGRVLFAGPRNLSLWMEHVERNSATVQRWFFRGDPRAAEPGEADVPDASASPAEPDAALLPLAIVRSGSAQPVAADMSFRRKDQLHVLVSDERRREAEEWLRQQGWEPWREKESKDSDPTD